MVRDNNGDVVIGEQYQNHNPRPGPVYAGGGLTYFSDTLASNQTFVNEVLSQMPSWANVGVCKYQVQKGVRKVPNFPLKSGF